MFLGAVTNAMREHAGALQRGMDEVEGLAEALGTSLAGVAWTGQDRESFEKRARATFENLEGCASELGRLAGDLEREADEQDRVSEPDAGDLSARSPGNGGRDQEDPETIPGMSEPTPYDGTEQEAEENIGARGLEQGAVNDCWYLAALMGIAERDPDYIREHMWKNDDGTWTVKMYKDGEPVEIIVESEFSSDGALHRVPVHGADGEPVRDADGEPVMEVMTARSCRGMSTTSQASSRLGRWRPTGASRPRTGSTSRTPGGQMGANWAVPSDRVISI